jgi:hypothetical protein
MDPQNHIIPDHLLQLRAHSVPSVPRPLVREDVVYGIITDFLLEHKVPSDRFVICPQLSIPWNPANPFDRRREVPDMAIVNFNLADHPILYRLRLGIEAKRPVPVMANLPLPDLIQDEVVVRSAFHTARFQAENQAKAAYKNERIANPLGGVPWLLFVGPYWALEHFGPFTAEQLTVRSRKTSDSGDFLASEELEAALAGAPDPVVLQLLGTAASVTRIEEILVATD